MGAGRTTREQQGEAANGTLAEGLRGRAVKIALPLAAALGIGAAVAVAAIPGSDGTIAGCYAGPTGAVITINGGSAPYNEAPGSLRVIDPSLAGGTASPAETACQSGETQISWNQRGPTGPQGPAGSSAGGTATFSLQSKSGLTYLKLDGISGTAKDKKHKGSIELESWSFGATNPRVASGGGGGSGHGSQSLTVWKRVDAASPKLFAAAQSGKSIKHAELILVRKRKRKPSEDFLRIEMSHVLISSIHDEPSSKGATPREEVSLTFRKIEWMFLDRGGRASGSASPMLTISGK